MKIPAGPTPSEVALRYGPQRSVYSKHGTERRRRDTQIFRTLICHYKSDDYEALKFHLSMKLWIPVIYLP
jgi:hypothetical protein